MTTLSSPQVSARALLLNELMNDTVDYFGSEGLVHRLMKAENRVFVGKLCQVRLERCFLLVCLFDEVT